MTQHNNNIIITPGLQFLDSTVQTTAWTGSAPWTTTTSGNINAITNTNQLVLVSDNSNRPAYYNTTETNWVYVGLETQVYHQFSPADISGLLAWYDTTSVNLGAGVWTDKSGNSYNATINGSPTLSANSGNGATGNFNELVGVAGPDSIIFPSGILPSTYSLFTVSRYNGSNKARIFSNNGGGTTWLSGHWNNLTGVAYHEGWLVDPHDYGWGNNWIINADHNYFYRANGRTSDSGTGGSGASTSVLSVSGPDLGAEQSDWAVAECVVYNRNLNSTEISTMETYLSTKYGITLG